MGSRATVVLEVGLGPSRNDSRYVTLRYLHSIRMVMSCHHMSMPTSTSLAKPARTDSSSRVEDGGLGDRLSNRQTLLRRRSCEFTVRPSQVLAEY
jgi:hypothetical protein